MDFSYLSKLSYDRRTDTKDGKRQILAPTRKQEDSNNKKAVSSNAIHSFLARRQQEEKQKYEEFQKKKEELLSLRSQSTKNNKKAKLMASRTRDNDFSKIKLTEDEEEAKAKREKELQRKGLYNKVERMKARIELEERDNQLPHKRKRKSHLLAKEEEPLNDVIDNTKSSVKIEYKFNGNSVPVSVAVHQKNEVKRKISNYQPKSAPVLNYGDLLQVAAKKQYEPIPLPDEDFEESDYSEEDGIDEDKVDKINHYSTSKREEGIPEKYISNQNRTNEKAKLNSQSLNIHESRQNKENAYVNNNHNSYKDSHSVSREHGKNVNIRNQSKSSFSQKHQLTNSSNCVALHAKENQTTDNKEDICSSGNYLHSKSSKYQCDSTNKDDIVNRRNVNRPIKFSKQDNSKHKANVLHREHLKNVEVQYSDKTKFKNQPNHIQTSKAQNSNHSDVSSLNRKHELTLKSNVRSTVDNRCNVSAAGAPILKHSAENSKNTCNVVRSVTKHSLKKDSETASNRSHNHCASKEKKSVGSSQTFKIPKKKSSTVQSQQDNTTCYYTDNRSDSAEYVKHSKVAKLHSSKVDDNHVSKQSSTSRRLQENPSCLKDINNADTLCSNNTREQMMKKKHVNSTPKHENLTEVKHRSQHFNGKLNEKYSHSKSLDKFSNKPVKISNANEYFTEEGQNKTRPNLSIKSESVKDKVKNKSERTSSIEICQYFTEQFTGSETKCQQRIDVLQNSNSKINNSSNHEVPKRNAHFDEHSRTTIGRSSQTKHDVKHHKHEKNKVAPQENTKAKQPQYFTESFNTGESNKTKNNVPKYDTKNSASQKEKQMKHTQYFTENFESNENNTIKNRDHKCRKENASMREEERLKQSQYFTEDFVSGQKSNPKVRHDKNAVVPQKEKEVKHSQYFTEHFNKDGNSTSKNNDKWDKKTSLLQKERKMKQLQYYTENFAANESNKTKTSESSHKDEKRISLSQKEKQMKHSQYFTENFVTDKHNTSINPACKSEKRTTAPQKEKQSKHPQYFTDCFIAEENHCTKSNNMNQTRKKSSALSQIEKSKTKQSQNAYKIEENVREKFSDKHVYHHTSQIQNDHAYKPERINRIPKRPREQQPEEVDPLPNKLCRYETPVSNKIENSRIDKLHKEKSKTSFSNSRKELELQDTKQKVITEANESRKKIAGQAPRSKVLNSETRNFEQEKRSSNLVPDKKVKDYNHRSSSSEQISFRKPEKVLLGDRMTSSKSLCHQNKDSSLKQTLPTKAKQIIPASSMAQMMYKKRPLSSPSGEMLGAKTQCLNMENSKPKKVTESSSDTKRIENKKLDRSLTSLVKCDSAKHPVTKQVHNDAKPAMNQQKPSSFQRPEKEAHYQKSNLADRPRNLVRKPIPSHDRRIQQAHNKNRNRFTRPSPRMFIKRNVDTDEEEEDDEECEDDMSDFIDDGSIEEDEEDYSHYIREIFGYDRRRYRFEEDLDDRDMETSYVQQMKEEKRSARIGLLEDLEDMRKEEEEKKKKAKKQR